MEEAEEVARAAREESDERVDEEAADVLYHLLGAAAQPRPAPGATPSGCSMAVDVSPSLEQVARCSRASTT